MKGLVIKMAACDEFNEEGCLSLPGIYAKIKISRKCKIIAIGLDGNQFTEQAQGLEAISN